MGSGGDQTAATCQSCREKHLRCDLDVDYAPEPGVEPPPCARCVASGKKCIRARAVRFKFHSLLPKAGQRWVRLPRRFYFVNETDEIKALYTLQSGTTYYPYVLNTPRDPPGSDAPDQPHQSDVHCKSTPSASSAATPRLPRTATDRRVYTAIPADSQLGLVNPGELTDAVVFPLRRSVEVRLMRYYLEHMCKWFDLCDAQRHFARELPRRAITCPTLLNAIFALSSRHMSMNEQFDQYAADWYHQECLNHLSTIYVDTSALANDDLLASTILLRTLEEMDVPLIGADHEGHLHGIQLFMNTPGATSMASGLRQACFWIGLRQEIVMAFVKQRPVKIKLDHDFVDRSLTPTNDDTWANRIIVHCAEVINFCFGEGDQLSIADFQALKEYDEAWLRARPISFLPVAYCEADLSTGEVFPQILYLNHAVVIGLAHANFARALLMCYDPTIPRIGPGQKIAQQKLDDCIRSQIRELCATALSNRATIPAMFAASMGVTMCGDRFTEDAERHALLDVLVKTESIHSWPTAGAQDHLKKAWGWVIES